MLSGIKASFQKQKIVFRVTLWYSIFLFFFILLLLGLAFFFSHTLSKTAQRKDLIESANKVSHQLTSYQAIDDGIYYSLYDSEGKLLKKSLPRDFDAQLAFSQGEAKEIQLGPKTYLYYDIEIKERKQWLRAVTLTAHSNHELTDFLLAIFIISPLLLIIIILGGYLLLKNAFNPIEQLSQTVLDIQKSGDLAKRLHLPAKDDEVHRLTGAFNQMLDSIQAALQRERLFSRNVSHELRTPLAVILSESEYGLTYAENLAEAQESFAIIKNQTQKMREMIGEILELNRLENRQQIEKQVFSLSQLLQDKVQDLERLSQELGKELLLKEIPDCQIEANQLLTHRLLDNLLSNALKFAQNKVEIQLSMKKDLAYLTISDDGPGIAAPELDKIWQPFYQINPARNKNEQEGSGLGLALVKQIIALHAPDMTIDVQSKPGQGSRFLLKIRLKNRPRKQDQ
ncbi:HAMP domain-containing sensor histidine kinase [Streptococcus oricebi]|uniref:histidine kinase n=1 Tax=Streptococcus oricebi TaxID=1547447 RepID=A0ABS5B5Q5_9STRE|nr:HAMP domain-containing sensor histidine kinase [Streptococcus oricebi]MBP2623816.1 sensor histidine kinase [Streptococcus oricebi]